MRGISRVCLILVFLSFSASHFASAEFRYYGKGKRDPFVPLILGIGQTSLGLRSVETIEDLKFEGVVYDPDGQSIAILNSELMCEGDRLYNVRLLKIKNDSIEIEIHENVYTVNLVEEGGGAID